MENEKKIHVDVEGGLRLDKSLSVHMPDISRTQLQEWISHGHVLVNDTQEKSNYKVKLGDVITLSIPENKNLDVNSENIPLDIVYEDSDVIVVNKPTGMIVHPSPGITSGTLVNALLYHCKDLSGINGVHRPGIVHRLDKDTSGLLVVAKNDNAHKHLSKQLQEHTVVRRYIALVHGEIPHEFGKIDAPIGRDQKDRQKMTVTKTNSKKAVTNFNVIQRFNNMCLVECRLETGRTHQIRVHLSYINYPVYGDPKYGKRKDDQTNGQYLHAKILGFIHPTTNEYMEFNSTLPTFFEDTIKALEEAKVNE